jgi:VWFA-related protein
LEGSFSEESGEEARSVVAIIAAVRRNPQLSSALLVLFCGLAAFSSGGPPALSQAASEQDPADEAPEEAFFEAVHVQVVNIDVWVTDKQGKPVGDLDKDDFLVFRDGEPVEVTNFYAVSGGRPVTTTVGPEATPSPAPLVGEPPSRAPEVAPEHRLWLIVYIDNYNLDPNERDRVLPALDTFLGRTLGAGDQAMLVTYKRALEVRQPFTDQLSLLRSALDTLKRESGLAVVRRRDRMDTLKLIDDTNDAGQALTYARQYAEEQMNGVDYTVDALRRLIDTLAGLPGRKALLYVSSGVPMLPGEEMFHAVAEKFNLSEAYSEIPRHDTTRRFERVIRRANEQRVTFHTMDAGGLKGIEFGAAEYAGFVDMNLRSTLDSVVPENLQSSLRFLAVETGGRAILNRNEVLPALDEVAQDFRSFYSLGVSASNVDSGRYHRLEVKLRERRKGVRLRHRAGYRSKSLDERIRERLRAALLYAHQENSLDVELRWGRAEPQGDKGLYLLPIQVRVPLRDLVLLPTTAGKHEARLELFVGAVGEDSRPSPIQDAPFGLRLADEHVEAARGEALLHTHQLLLNSGRQKVGVAVLDLFGGQASVVTAFVDVGPTAEPGSPSQGP